MTMTTRVHGSLEMANCVLGHKLDITTDVGGGDLRLVDSSGNPGLVISAVEACDQFSEKDMSAQMLLGALQELADNPKMAYFEKDVWCGRTNCIWNNGFPENALANFKTVVGN